MTVALIQNNLSDGLRPPLQTDGGTNALHNYVSDFVSAQSAAGEDVVDVRLFRSVAALLSN